MYFQHAAEIGNSAGSEGFDRSGRYGIYSDPVNTKIIGQVSDVSLKSGFSHTHDIVVGDDFFRTEVCQSNNTSAIGH